MTREDREYAAQVRDALMEAEVGSRRFDELRDLLEQEHWLEFVRIDIATGEYVTAQTEPEVDALFTKRFGKDRSQFCAHIGRPNLA